MTRFLGEYGKVYDVLAFFNCYFNKSAPQNAEKEFEKIYGLTERGAFDFVPYLLPFSYGAAVEDCLLYKMAFDKKPYESSSLEHLKRTLQNKTYTQRTFIEHFIKDANSSVIQKLMRLEHPFTIDLLRAATLPAEIETYFLYTLIHFDEVVDVLIQALQRAYAWVDQLHKEFLQQETALVNVSVSDLTAKKLCAITCIPADTNLTVSISLLNASLLYPCAENPAEFLLGKGFEDVLHSQYRYAAVTPFTFAQAIGSQAKYDIYKALLAHSPQSTSELSRNLHLSKNSMAYNLNEMVKQGILELEQIGLSYYYRVDLGYIRFVSDLLGMDSSKNIKIKGGNHD